MDVLKEYFERFSRLDKDAISRPFCSLEFLRENLPVFTCSDKTIEEIYYFRAYTLSKHIKKNSKGQYIVTEFPIPVHWASDTEGAISCAVGHHFRELRWFKGCNFVLRSYADFWLDNIDRLLYYNCWFISGLLDSLKTSGDYEYAYSKADKLVEYLERQISEHLSRNGMYKSVDNYDGMELSISAYGVRTTINSYIYANAVALADIFVRFNDRREKKYREFAQGLKKDINEKLFKEDFYYHLPLQSGETDEKYIPTFTNPTPKWGVKELSGYVPFYFGISEKRHTAAFKYLKDERVFKSKYGLTTADKSDVQFNYYFPHSCLWNGPVWPFATSQTLTGAARYLQEYGDISISADDFCDALHTYALSQHITENGVTRPFIDENLDGDTGEWLAKKWIENKESQTYPNGRGYDYNHSTYIDLVITGLCGVCLDGGKPAYKPIIGKNIEYFTLTGVKIKNELYKITYDKNSTYSVEAMHNKSNEV